MVAAWMRGRWRRSARTESNYERPDFCSSACSSPAGSVSEQPEDLRMWMTVGERRFSITLADNATARAFAAQLPLTLDMSELNGNEKHADLPKPLPGHASRPGTIRNGDSHAVWRGHLGGLYLTFQSSCTPTPASVESTSLPTCHRRLGRAVFESDFPRTSLLNDSGRHDERHKNESASWVVAALRLADGTCDPDVLVRPRFRRNARR